MSEHAFPLIVDHEREYLAGDVIRKAVEHDAATMRFYLTCSVGELAQRVVLALTVPPASAPAATAEPERCADCGHTKRWHHSKGGCQYNGAALRSHRVGGNAPNCGCRTFRPAAPTGEEAERDADTPEEWLRAAEVMYPGEVPPRPVTMTALLAQATELAALRARVEELAQEAIGAAYSEGATDTDPTASESKRERVAARARETKQALDAALAEASAIPAPAPRPPSHVCGARGFGLSPDDQCPACAALAPRQTTGDEHG